MQIQNLIKPSATVVRVLTLSENDVYKRVEKDYSGTRIVLGQVTGVLASEDSTAVTAVEYDVSRYEPAVTSKTFQGDEDVLIHAATPDDLAVILRDLDEGMAREIREKERALASARSKADQIEGLRGALESGVLSATPSEVVQAVES